MEIMKILVLAFLVSWDVSGFNFSQCNDPKRIAPAVGMCVDPFSMSRSAVLPDKATAEKVADTFRKDKSTAYKITNVRVYQETK